MPGSGAFLSDTGSGSDLTGRERGILNVESRCLCGPFLRVSRYEAKLESGLAIGRIIPKKKIDLNWYSRCWGVRRFSISIRDGEIEAMRWGIQALKYIKKFRSELKEKKDVIKQK